MVIVKSVVLLCLLIMPTAVGAFQNEPNGYRDIHWGTNIEKIQKGRKVDFLSQFPNPNIKQYSITLNDKENRGMYGFPIIGFGKSGKLELGTIQAMAWKGKIYYLTIRLAGQKEGLDVMYNVLLDNMIAYFGKPSKLEDEKSAQWVGETSMIEIRKSPLINNRGEDYSAVWIYMRSVAMQKQIKLDTAAQGW